MIRKLLGLAALKEQTFYAVVSQLRRDGWLEVTGRTRWSRMIALREPEGTCPVFAVRGSRLSEPLFEGYEKVTPA